MAYRAPLPLLPFSPHTLVQPFDRLYLHSWAGSLGLLAPSVATSIRYRLLHVTRSRERRQGITSGAETNQHAKPSPYGDNTYKSLGRAVKECLNLAFMTYCGCGLIAGETGASRARNNSCFHLGRVFKARECAASVVRPPDDDGPAGVLTCLALRYLLPLPG